MFRAATHAPSPLPRVDLMPRAETERRRRGALLRRWLGALVAATIVACLLIGGGVAFRAIAEQRLHAAQAHTNTLLTELSSLSEVSAALATQRDLQAYRTEAMAGDLDWAPALRLIDSALPDDVLLIGFDLAAGGVPEGTDPALEVGLLGTITLRSPTPIEIVEVARTLRGLEGISDADGREVRVEPPVEDEPATYSYILTVTFDQSIYSGAFAVDGEGGQG